MKLSIKGAALAAGLLWGGCILFVGAIGLAAPGYGKAFLDSIASVYPGYDNTGSILEVLVGTVYGLLDGAIAGALFAWLYNLTTRSSTP